MNLLMSASQNSYVFANLLIKSLIKSLLWLLLNFKDLNINLSFSIGIY